YRLAAAMSEWPALGSDDWNAALQEGIQAIEQEERRKSTAERLEVLLKPSVKSKRYPAGELRRRVNVLVRWLQGNQATCEPVEVIRWASAIAEAEALMTISELSGLDYFSRAQLSSLLGRVREGADREPILEHQAGLASASNPGAVAGPARRILWWNFTRSSAPTIRDLSLYRSEVCALAEAGIEVPSASSEALRRRESWLRPLACAEMSVLLVC